MNIAAGVADLPIVPARPQDADALRDLTRAAYATWADLIGREPKPMAADHAAAIRDHMVHLAWDGAALVGAVEMILREGDLLIENIAVAPAAQRRGLGSRLLAHAETTALAHGRATVRLYTNQRFATNVALYLRRGYRIEREEPFAGGVVVHMVRQP